jgi:hypothetical protein
MWHCRDNVILQYFIYWARIKCDEWAGWIKSSPTNLFSSFGRFCVPLFLRTSSEGAFKKFFLTHTHTRTAISTLPFLETHDSVAPYDIFARERGHVCVSQCALDEISIRDNIYSARDSKNMDGLSIINIYLCNHFSPSLVLISLFLFSAKMNDLLCATGVCRVTQSERCVQPCVRSRKSLIECCFSRKMSRNREREREKSKTQQNRSHDWSRKPAGNEYSSGAQTANTTAKIPFPSPLYVVGGFTFAQRERERAPF